LVQDANLLIPGRIERNSDGHLVLRATPTRLGIYVPGTGQFRIVDLLGLFLFVGAFLGSAGHGAVRIHLARKRKAARLANEEQKP
jgi:hypothetical protein